MPRLIALDLGSHAVKGSLFQVNGRSGIELEQRFHRFVPQDGPSPTLEHRLAALDALLDDHPSLKPSGSDVVVLAWPSSEAAFHRMTMPFSDRAQIERALPFAVESEVPFELTDMVLAWRIAEQTPQTQVMVALARRARLSEWLAALAERGIDPAAVHVDADLFGPWGGGVVVDEAPTEIVGLGVDPSEPLIALIDVGHLHTTVSVVRGGVVQVARSINVAGHAFTRAVAEADGCSWVEAEQRKHGADEPDVSPDEEPTAGNDDDGGGVHSGYARLSEAARTKLDAAIGLLLAEIRSTLIQAEDVLGSEVVEVRLCGGSARIDELWEDLETNLGVPVRPALDPQGQASSGPFAVCQALALVSVSGAPPIDLRVGEFVYRGRTDMLRAALGYGVSGAVFFCLAALLMFAWQYRSLMVEQSSTEDAVREIVTRAVPDVPESALDTLGKAEALLAGLTEDAIQRADVLGDGSGGVPPTIDTLYALTQAFPPHSEVQVEVSDLVIAPNVSISFNAETDGFQSSSRVEKSLTDVARFQLATKGQEQKLNNGRVRFPISIPLGQEIPDGGAADETSGAEPANEEG
jgi:Tfp pilus assembly PilM family ATPase